MLLEKNLEAINRKHFLVRALDQKRITREQYDKEIKLLDPFLKKNITAELIKQSVEINSEVYKIKQVVKQDGDFKRAIASYLIGLLKEHLIDDEIKGVMRQGYKLMRLKDGKNNI